MRQRGVTRLTTHNLFSKSLSALLVQPDSTHNLYGKSLSTSLIRRQSQQISVADLGLRGWWRLNNSSGTSASDSSGYDLTGTITGASWVTGKVGNALRFSDPTHQVIASAPNITSGGLADYAGNPLSIPKYGGTGVVHADAMYLSPAVGGYSYWMVYTPYPPDSEEEPSIVRSNNGVTWVDTGISNPVVPTGGVGEFDEYDCPDPTILYVSDYSKFFIVYVGNAVYNGKWGTHGNIKIGLSYSSDGITWTKKGVLIDGSASYEKFSDTGESALQQPALIYESGTFHLWYVASCDGSTLLAGQRGKLLYATFTWNDATNAVENLTRSGSNPILWPAANYEFKSGIGHMSVVKSGSTYYMCALREVLSVLAYEMCWYTSTDKVTWRYQGKLVPRGVAGRWNDTYVYRGNLLHDGLGSIVTSNNLYNLYYSGFNGSIYSIGYASGSLPTRHVTISTWIKRNGEQTSDAEIVGVDSNGYPWYDYGLYLTESDKINFTLATDNTQLIITTGSVIPDLTWKLVVGSYDGSHMKIYIDNALVLSEAVDNPNLNITVQDDSIFFGNFRYDDSVPFVGDIDDVRVYSQALTLPDIQGIYNLSAAYYSLPQYSNILMSNIAVTVNMR